MKNIFRVLTLGLLLSGAWACSSVDEFVEPDVVPSPNDEKTITMVVENDAESRALFTGQNEDGDWELAFINGDVGGCCGNFARILSCAQIQPHLERVERP